MPETTFELTKEELPQNGMIPKEYKAVWGEKKLNIQQGKQKQAY